MLVNFVVAVFIIVAFTFLEISARLSPSQLSASLLDSLPARVKWEISHLNKSKGFEFAGNEMLYYYPPNWRIPEKPWLTIDKRGMRNPSAQKIDADVVLLGDSLTFASGAHRDLAYHFRSKGRSTINLSMGGYSPQHYRDAYQRFIVTPKVAHQVVMVISSLPNDLLDALIYKSILAQGGDYRHFGRSDTPPPWNHKWEIYYPWYGYYALNAMHKFKNFIDRRGGRLREFKKFDFEVALPYGVKSVDKYDLNLPTPKRLNIGVQLYLEALLEIAQMAKSKGANMMLVQLPSPLEPYADFVKSNSNIVRQYSDMITKLRREVACRLVPTNIVVIDALDTIKIAVRRSLQHEAILEYHPNDSGVESLFKFIEPVVSKLISGGTVKSLACPMSK